MGVGCMCVLYGTCMILDKSMGYITPSNGFADRAVLWYLPTKPFCNLLKVSIWHLTQIICV